VSLGGVEINAQEVPDREPMLSKRPSPEEILGEVSGSREDLLLQRLSASHSE